MRANHPVWTRSLWSVVVAAAAVGLNATGATAESVHLIAAPVTKAITMPNGTTVPVPMWGYALDANDNGVLDAGELVTVPGPRLVVPVGDTSLTIRLTNLLPEATSLVIPGQLASEGAAPRVGGRIRSMAAETTTGSTGTYIFTDVRPGTFLYESGSHQAVQVQMGLYGAMTKDASTGYAYAGVAYAHEAVLVYSEVDQTLHQAVNDGTYGTPAGPTSTVNYRPSLFLINGESYASESTVMAAGTALETTLLRMVNAGLRTHAPVLDNGHLRIVAEDGNKLPFAKNQAAVMLAAGKTHDALWTPGTDGVYSLYDRILDLNAPGQGSAGMLAKLSIGLAGAPGAGYPVAANDSVSGVEDAAAISGSVLGNDTNAVSAVLVASPRTGALSFSSTGVFSYTPSANFFGVDAFSYRAVSGTGVQSAPALVTITVTGVPDAPVASAQAFGVDAGANASVTLSGTDADGDALGYFLTSLPAHGGLSYIDPVTKVETPIGAADLHPAATKKSISGAVIYTPTPAYDGPDSFEFLAFDGGLSSAQAALAATVYPGEGSAVAELTQPVTLTVVGADGVPIANYRWTLEEDLTYRVVPGVADPNTLAVSLHRSYMPVVASGDESQGVMVNPAKRYFVSVLPTENTYSTGGAKIDAGQIAATVTVAKLPLPTARIRVRVFQDNAPLNGQWDATEPGLQGFQVTIDDAGGTYGMSGGPQSTDAFGNKIGTTYEECATGPGTCDSYQVAQLGQGFIPTDADGYAVIENLVMGKYTVKVRAPGGVQWVQTTTIEGTKGIDAWVKPNEPQFFTEFGPPGPHVFVGFTEALTGAGLLGVGPGPFSTISGRVTNMRMSRPPEVALSSGAPFTHTRAWVALNSAATGGSLMYAQPTNEDGTFSISGVSSGSYQLVVFDSVLDLIIGSTVVNVAAPAPQNLGDVAVFNWFTNLYNFVFDDKNGDGIHQADEPGMPDQALNIRFRDGSIYQTTSTDERGFKAFNEVFPFFAWLVAEVDYARNHSTGITVVVDGGGDSSAAGSNAYDWQAQAGLPAGLIPPESLNPQPQPDNGNRPFRTESGAETPFLLLEGFQSFIGQSTVMLWGKAPYQQPGSFVEEVNVAPFDDFPGPGDVDNNGDGFFNTDRSNGGIAGIIHYGITRAENDPRFATAENWEPGVSDVRVQLWDENRTHLLNEVTTDNWNNSLPEGCQWDQPFSYLGNTISANQGCFDGLRVFNQARPALFDGGYAFSTIFQDDVTHPTYTLPVAARQVERPLPAGKYVVKIIVPPGYKLQKEEDKNVDFGDSYVPQQFWLAGYPLADGGPSDAQPAPTVQNNNLLAAFCVGALHEVPATLSLFPGQVASAFAGEWRPLCDAKLVTLRDGQQVAPDFHLFTEAPIAAHIYGMVLDDTTNEFDPNAPNFAEKYAVPFVAVAIRDWQGREVARTYTDQYGMYNALVPSSYTANPPEPSGVSPNILSACINSPTMPGPGGSVVADPSFLKQYSHFCYQFQYLAGKTTYLDTPVVPTGAFTGTGTFPVDAELPNNTPVIASATGPNPASDTFDPANPYGPYIVDRGAGNDTARTVVITSAAALTGDGLTEVANPAFDGAGGLEPALIKRDYGFGAGGTVLLGTVPNQIVVPVTSWTNTAITAVVPTGATTGELSVVRDAGAAARKSTLGITLSVATTAMHAIRPPTTVAEGQSIQTAIDAATPGDLILVRPGVFEEMVVMSKPVRLQGAGALSTIINVVTTPTENLQTWLDKVGNLLLSSPSYRLTNQPAVTPPPFQPGDVAAVVGDEGPGVLVLSKNDLTFAGECGYLGSNDPAQRWRNFAQPLNEAYCQHNESYIGGADDGAGDSAKVLRPNARIDGFSLLGASTAPGVLVNGYAHYLEVSNNKIYTNSGTYAGGVQVGHAGATEPLSDEDANNDHVAIHHNMITQNAGIVNGGGGGVVLGAGSTSYVVQSNFIAANLAAGNGGGIAHIGLSPNGVIDANTVIFNESFYQGQGTNGGGIFIGGTPAAVGASTLGSGRVDVTNNLIQGNAASGGDGGGIALLGFTNADRVSLYNNVIANNVAGLAGGGISIAGLPAEAGTTPWVDIAHDTIVNNDSTGTAGAAFADPLLSTPQPAGIAGRGPMAHVRIANSIVWHNRTFSFGPQPAGPEPGPTQFGEIQIAARPYWDLGVLTGGAFSPMASVLSALSGPSNSANYLAGTNDVSYSADNNSSTAPMFVNSYFNTDRRFALQGGEATLLISVPAALDEGGNFIRPQFGPLTLEDPDSDPGPFFGNYHLTLGNGVTGQNLCGIGTTLFGDCGVADANVPGALLTDFDRQGRPTNEAHRGADQVIAPVSTTPVPQR